MTDLETTIRIHRPDHRHANREGWLTIVVGGSMGRTEAPSRHCPGDRGVVKLDPGPYHIEGTTSHLFGGLTLDESTKADQAIRDRARDVREWGEG